MSEVHWIQKTNPEAITPIDKYYLNVYCPFVGSVIVLCNNCEYLLARVFAACGLRFRKRTLGQKIEEIKRNIQVFEEMIGQEALAGLLERLGETNRYFNLAKHAHLAVTGEVGNDQRLLNPGFDFDSVNLTIADVSTLQQITLTPAERKRIEHQIAGSAKALIPLFKSAMDRSGNDQRTGSETTIAPNPEIPRAS